MDSTLLVKKKTRSILPSEKSKSSIDLVLDNHTAAKAVLDQQRADYTETASERWDAPHRGWTTLESTPTTATAGPRRVKADLVLVGSNEAGALMRVFLGSTARSVLRQAPCSVEIVRPLTKEKRASEGSGMKILVATDGSEYSTAALRSVASCPWPKGSKIKVISIPEPFMPLGQLPYFELKEIENLNTSALKDAKRYAADGTEILAKAGLQAESETPLPIDSDAREIVKGAERWQAQMVVLGSHGRRGFDLMTMGSVSEHVALHAPCSVEVIRMPAATNRKSKPSSKKGRSR